MRHGRSFWIDFYYRPGQYLGDEHLRALARDLRTIGADPEGRAGLDPTRSDLAQRVVTLARRRDGTVAAVATARLRTLDGVGTVLDLEPVRVGAGVEPAQITAQLRFSLIRTFLRRRSPLGRVWFTQRGTPEGARIPTGHGGLAARRRAAARLGVDPAALGLANLAWVLGHAVERGLDAWVGELGGEQRAQEAPRPALVLGGPHAVGLGYLAPRA